MNLQSAAITQMMSARTHREPILLLSRVGFVGGAERVLLAAGETMGYRGHRVTPGGTGADRFLLSL
jgi:hypothetical protein